MNLSIIIPAFNEEHYIGECLASCVKYAPSNLIEIIVVNNACTDKTEEVAKQFPLVRVVREPVKGITRARQKGFEETKGDIIISIDADTRIRAGWFESMQEVLKQPNVVCVSGVYYFYDLPGWQRFIVMLYWSFFEQMSYFLVGYVVVGGNFAVKREALTQIGGFDTSIQFYGEDSDIGRRLYAIGKVAYSRTCWTNTSGRRLKRQGIVMAPFIYAINSLWIAMFHRPFSKTYEDIR